MMKLGIERLRRLPSVPPFQVSLCKLLTEEKNELRSDFIECASQWSITIPLFCASNISKVSWVRIPEGGRVEFWLLTGLCPSLVSLQTR